MRKKWTNNLGIKILSLGLAALIWVIIVNVDDPARTKTFSGISVQLKNEDAITSEHQVFEVVEGAKVDVKVKANKSILDKLNASDLIVTADLENINSLGSVQILVECNRFSSSNIELELGKVKYLKVSLENVKTESKRVDVITIGTEAEGFSIGDIKATPNMIEVSGAESQIEKIDKVVVEANVSNADHDYSERLEPKAYDKENKLIDSEKITFSASLITVSATVLPTKMVPIELTFTGNTAHGYQFVESESEYQPKEIEIVAKQSVLDSITSIPIKVDIEGATENKEIEVNLLGYIDEKKVKLANTADQTIVVNVKIEKLETKEITFSANEIDTKNLPDNMQFNFSQSEASFSISIMGLKADLDKITVNSLAPYIDLKEMVVGTQEVEIQFSNELKIEYLNKIKVSIVLVDMAAAPSATPEATIAPIATTSPEVPEVITPTVAPE